MNPAENDIQRRIVTADVIFCKVVSDGTLVEVSTRLTYHPADPYAVAATFSPHDTPVTWMCGRDLLDQGMNEPVGEGDLLVWPSLDTEGAHGRDAGAGRACGARPAAGPHP